MSKRRITALAAACTGAILLSACSIIKTWPQVNTARFHSDLSLTMISAEKMDREYYDLEELEALVLSSVNAYNEANPDAISIDYYHVDGELATLILTYTGADHCAAFNGQPLVYCQALEAAEGSLPEEALWIPAGTAIEEASRAGTASTAAAAEESALAATAEESAAGDTGTGGAMEAAPEADYSNMDLSGMRFIRLTEKLSVETEDTIAYVSGPVTVTDEHTCVTGEDVSEDDPVCLLLYAEENP